MFDCVCFVYSFAAIHRRGFIFFVIFSSLHMLLTCYLFKRGCPTPWSSSVSAYGSYICKWLMVMLFYVIGKGCMEVANVDSNSICTNADRWHLLLHPKTFVLWTLQYPFWLHSLYIAIYIHSRDRRLSGNGEFFIWSANTS